MREIIHISTGQCGNQIGSAFWDTISEEHGIDGSGRLVTDNASSGSTSFNGNSSAQDKTNDRLDVYYAQSGNRYIPRAVMVDLEPATLDHIRSGPRGDLYRPDNFVNSLASAGNNWAKGYYTEGTEVAERVMDVIRREVEITDNFQGFQLTHSLGGGTGSGLGTLLITQLNDEYSDRMIASYSVFPSSDSDTVVEPYNSVLALSQLLETTNETFCLDNHALYSIFQNTLKKPHPSHTDLNGLVAQVMSGVTTSLRYPGQLNSDLRKLAVNLVPYSRLHFFTVGYAPLVAPGSRKFASLSVPEMTQQILDGRSVMAGVNPREGRYLACAALYRGKASVKEIEDEMTKYRKRNEDLFVGFIPDNLQTSLCPVAPKTAETAATFVANSTSITQLFSRIHDQFRKMYSRRAFLHWYTSEGMDEHEFAEAEGNLTDLCRDYQQHQSSMDDEGIIIDAEAEMVADGYQESYPYTEAYAEEVAMPE